MKDKNLVTVWSAPNYCYRCNNLAAIMEIKETGEKEFKIFKTVPESMKSVHFKNVLPYFLWYEFLVFYPSFSFYFELFTFSLRNYLNKIYPKA